MGNENNNVNPTTTTTNAGVDDVFKLVGFSKFVRTNPKSDRFRGKRFHHVEFWCGDATNTVGRFSWGLGMPLISKFDLSTENLSHTSYLLRSGDRLFFFTAAYSPAIGSARDSTPFVPSFDYVTFLSFSL